MRVERLRAGYGGVEILHGVDLTVPQGSVVALLGPNGAGKSTIARSVAGLLAVNAGRIGIHGTQIHRLPAHHRARLGLSLVPEDRGLFPGLSVLDNLRLGARRAGRRGIAERVPAVFDLFPVLAERRDQIAQTLSGGQLQMLAIGKALMSVPRYLLLDEPSLGLAPTIVDDVLAALAELARGGLGVLLIEQNAVKALRVANEAIVLERGRVVLRGPAAQLAADERIHASYLGGV